MSKSHLLSAFIMAALVVFGSACTGGSDDGKNDASTSSISTANPSSAVAKPSEGKSPARYIVAVDPTMVAHAPNEQAAIEAFSARLDQNLHGVSDAEVVPDQPLLADGPRLIAVNVASTDQLTALAGFPGVAYVEPALIPMDSLACGSGEYTRSSDSRAYDDRLPALGTSGSDWVPYPYTHHRVQEAWSRIIASGKLPGAGQGVAVLDTGVSSEQEQFFSRYDTIYARRPHMRLNATTNGIWETTIPASIDDNCGHGTKVASIAAAPRDGRSVIGVAFASDLTTVKVVADPFADRAEVGSICQGIDYAIRPPDGRPPARVVAMALGLTYFSPTIAKCIENAFVASPGTIFLAAAGSIVTNVVFPANLDDFVVAVSMVEIRANEDGYRLMGRPKTVAYGPEVDYVSVSTASGIPSSGRVGSSTIDAIWPFSVSSAATSVYTGLVALASQYAGDRGWSRAQTLELLRQCSSSAMIRDFSGEPLEAVVGAGVLDAYCAVGGARNAIISGPYVASVGQEMRFDGSTDAAIPAGATPPPHHSYEWFVNGTAAGHGSRLTMTPTATGSLNVRLRVTDAADKRQLVTERTVRVDDTDIEPPTLYRMYAAGYVADWATFFNGGRHDRIVNNGKKMPEGCEVKDVRGILIDPSLPHPESSVPVSTLDNGNVGFTVSRPAGIALNDLTTLVHQWHDGSSIVRTKVVYSVLQPAGISCQIPGVVSSSP